MDFTVCTDFNPYDELEISKESSYEDVKFSYQKLIMLNHPDKILLRDSDISLDEANEKFRRIIKAWKMLSDPGTRRAFDALLEQRSNTIAASSEVALSAFMLSEERIYFKECRCGDKYEVC